MKFTSVINLFPPQTCHLKSKPAATHPVSLQICDYCAKTTSLTLSTPQFKLPAFQLIPETLDRFVFDEIFCEPQLFSDIHVTSIQQTLQPNSLQNSINSLAAQVVAETLGGCCKLVVNYGSLTSGHGLLAFGAPVTKSCDKVPNLGLIWSILDACGSCQVSAFSVEGTKIRDLLDGTPEGTLVLPKTQNGLVTPEMLSKQINKVENSVSGRLQLAKGLHLKRRVVGAYKELEKVTGGQFPLLGSILKQLGYQNHQIAMDVCNATAVLISMSNNAQILFLDFPVCYANSSLRDYRFDSGNLRFSSYLKNAFSRGFNTHESVISRILEGCVPDIFLRNGSVVQICNVQMSEFERKQTIQVLRMAGVFDKKVVERYFDAYEADKKRMNLSQSMRQEVEIQNLFEIGGDQHYKQEGKTMRVSQLLDFQDENSEENYQEIQIEIDESQHVGASVGVSQISFKDDKDNIVSAKELLNENSENGWDQNGTFFRSAEWQTETQVILGKMKAFLDTIEI